MTGKHASLTLVCLALFTGTALGDDNKAAAPGAKPAPAAQPAAAPKKATATPAPAAPAAAAKKPAPAPAPVPPADRARADIKTVLGFVPAFLNGVPESALPGAWEEMKGLQLNPNTALPGKIKELIGLAVAAQVPCEFCIYAHTKFAEIEGATKQEIGEGIILAALARHWATVFSGHQTDLKTFRSQIAGWVAHSKKQAAGAAPATKPVEVTDAATAKQDMQQALGSVPDFAAQVPPEALAGAWKELRDVQMNPKTALSGKHKSLIGLAVSSQIPCRFCIAANTEFARAEGATDREIDEAIGMAAITRHWSTYLNGMQLDQAAFKRDVNRLVRGAQKQKAATKAPVAVAPPSEKPAVPAKIASAEPQRTH